MVVFQKLNLIIYRLRIIWLPPVACNILVNSSAVHASPINLWVTPVSPVPSPPSFPSDTLYFSGLGARSPAMPSHVPTPLPDR